MARVPSSAVDPALDAASLLRRLGTLILMIGMPLGVMASRNAGLIVFTTGIALIVAASVFDAAARRPADSLARLGTNWPVVALAVLAGWTLLSLAWTPIPRSASLPGTGLVCVLTLAGYLALPDRMRAANLYLVPIGAAAAALAVIGLDALTPDNPADPESARRIERGAIAVVLLAWPSIAWLRSRGRDIEAVVLAIAAVIAAAVGPSMAPAFAFAFGAFVYVVVQAFGSRGASATGYTLAALVIVAPALLIWGVPPLKSVTLLSGWATAMEPWRDALMRNPHRLVTGRGIGALRASLVELWTARLLGAPIIALWYELGIVGALAVAAALAGGLARAGREFGTLVPAVSGAIATAFGLALSGIDGTETWWFAVLATMGLAFVGAERGQFRTRRPRLLGFGRAKPA